jgi:hypothetical protein
MKAFILRPRLEDLKRRYLDRSSTARQESTTKHQHFSTRPGTVVIARVFFRIGGTSQVYQVKLPRRCECALTISARFRLFTVFLDYLRMKFNHSSFTSPSGIAEHPGLCIRAFSVSPYPGFIDAAPKSAKISIALKSIVK